MATGTLQVCTPPLPVSVSAVEVPAAIEGLHSAAHVRPVMPGGAVKLLT